MKLLLDMNLSPQLAILLSRNGFDCSHWSAIGNPRAEDREILTWARKNSSIVITNDLDFGAILAATKFAAPSVIQIRRHDILPDSVLPVLLDSLQKYEKELEAGALIVIDELKSRVRILPL